VIRRTMLFGAAAVAVAGLAAGLSHATPPGKNGQIAFQRYELHDAPYAAHIVVANSDGSGQRTLTHASRRGIEDGEPDWAPDGSRIAFARCSPAVCSIYTVRPTARDLRRLSPRCPRTRPRLCKNDHDPAYSPDGRHIAFWRGNAEKANGGLMLMVGDAQLKHVHRLGPGYAPTWSPDGKRLVFLARTKNSQALYVSNADGSGRHRITPSGLPAGDQPDWSPDGTRILFLSGRADHGNLFTIRPDGTGLRQLTHYKTSGEKLTKVQAGSYSPDGQSIVFATVVGAVNPPGATLDDVFVMTADGTDIRPVTRARNWDGSPDWGPAR
jgi:Tol biopolymer transport system component